MSKSEKRSKNMAQKKTLFGANRRIALRDTREYPGGGGVGMADIITSKKSPCSIRDKSGKTGGKNMAIKSGKKYFGASTELFWEDQNML